MTDYSKPIGWWCNAEATQYSIEDLVYDGPCPDCIPVYAVIPEGEREETTIASLDELEVCTINDDDFAAGGALMSSDVFIEERSGQPEAARMAWFQNHQYRPADAAADAVLWVVEGRLPE